MVQWRGLERSFFLHFLLQTHMFVVYILRSQTHGKLYIGLTERDIKTRLAEHNSGGLKWSSGRGPFELVHQETYLSENLARKRESFLKTGKGGLGLRNRFGALK